MRRRQAFMKALLEDLRALAFMLEDDRVESGVTRIGAEQEMFLIDRYLRPAPVSLEVLKQANDPRLTTEIARLNLEANLSPFELTNDCFSRMEQELTELITLARNCATTQGAEVLLSGILPTLQKSDLTLENLTPIARYHDLDRVVIDCVAAHFQFTSKDWDRTKAFPQNLPCSLDNQRHGRLTYLIKLIETPDGRRKTARKSIPNPFQKLHKLRRSSDRNRRRGKYFAVVSYRAVPNGGQSLPRYCHIRHPAVVPNLRSCGNCDRDVD
jgi:hypothetical protein